MNREQPNIRETWRLYLPFGFECSWSNYQLMAVLLERWYWVMIISWDSQILCSECPALIDAFIWFSASLLAKHGEKQLLPLYLDRLGFPIDSTSTAWLVALFSWEFPCRGEESTNKLFQLWFLKQMWVLVDTSQMEANCQTELVPFF